MLDSTPTGWTTTQLRSVVKNVTTKWSDSGAEAKYIGLEHISQGSGRLEGTGSSAEVVSAKNVFKNGDVLFGKLRPNLKKFWRAEFDGICSTDILVLRPQSQLTSIFLSYLVQSTPFLGLATADAVGTKMPRTSWNRLGDFETALPPLPEQERISEVLTSVDDSIRATEAVIAQAERVKRGLMDDLLTGGLGSDAIARGEVPEGWQVKQVGELAGVKGGKRMPKGAPFSDVPTPYPYIRVSDFKNGTISKDDLKFVSPEHQEQIARYTIGKDDLYISIAGTLGIVGFVPKDLDGAQLTENAAKIILKDTSIISKEYLARVLQSEVGQAQIQVKKGVGGGVPKLALFRIGEINVPLPSMEEQQRIADAVGAVDAMLEDNYSLVDQLQRLKRGLMDDLLTGRVRTV